jgi:hypothetical protein
VHPKWREILAGLTERVKQVLSCGRFAYSVRTDNQLFSTLTEDITLFEKNVHTSNTGEAEWIALEF